ncbi:MULTISPECIES: hypothetical protein [unclassified Bosea (in: a-proteobacteria)]|uniref:hypothetical protein n=1 Tax=unclassified Bosea (in: a-proteobacteria) TaxID=2653178 RepID=UPI000F74EF17|nr:MULTISPECIES: hypothetical protein [unclassified Bosea (in: a-proteobacteria)]AZO77479.1 hypothetical protein BLM15_07535 [Bosea sp. Tri-49]RXT18084.1 hypothetical protein B5U98_22685 [Bosea sp. Tri-39]RXT32682.1 hypothetical protein B5U99_29030 [Bosea sp. Tri-54]
MAAAEYHAGQAPGSVTSREMVTDRPITRRLFVAGIAAFSAAPTTALAGAAHSPSNALTLTEEEIARGNEIARCSYMMRYLDERGATYEACGQAGWYQARWSDPAVMEEPIRWAASVDANDFDHLYARAFRARVEGIENF